MNCLDDLGEQPEKERWFDVPGGGKVQFRPIPPMEYRKMAKRCTTQKIDFKKVEGTPARLPYDSVDEDLMTRLFWDYAIVSWDEFSFRHPETKELILCTPKTCIADNKVILITCSSKFVAFANESMKTLADDDKVQKVKEQENFPSGQDT